MSTPTVITSSTGERGLVDSAGRIHPPRALVAAITTLEAQAASCERRGDPASATWLQREADRRRDWLHQLEAPTEVRCE